MSLLKDHLPRVVALVVAAALAVFAFALHEGRSTTDSRDSGGAGTFQVGDGPFAGGTDTAKRATDGSGAPHVRRSTSPPDQFGALADASLGTLPDASGSPVAGGHPAPERAGDPRPGHGGPRSPQRQIADPGPPTRRPLDRPRRRVPRPAPVPPRRRGPSTQPPNGTGQPPQGDTNPAPQGGPAGPQPATPIEDDTPLGPLDETGLDEPIDDVDAPPADNPDPAAASDPIPPVQDADADLDDLPVGGLDQTDIGAPLDETDQPPTP